MDVHQNQRVLSMGPLVRWLLCELKFKVWLGIHTQGPSKVQSASPSPLPVSMKLFIRGQPLHPDHLVQVVDVGRS